MSDIAIRVENLGKRYRLGESAPFRRLTRKLGRVFGHPRSADLAAANGQPSANGQPIALLDGPDEEPPEEIWALRDVSFDVKRGEVVGVIGRNGAGKSTLLKILSRITEPTTGRAEIHGRVGSLLEVGTGFHPELTGRENVYLNGAILGMSRAEITRKFDEIVEFSGVEKFLNTPVKRYSSGMRVRLAFSVAAHLDPEILIIDEVLAVGDVEFQKKCLGKMDSVARDGRTVLFVSHNLSAVESLCQTGILLEYGRVSRMEDASDIINQYLALLYSNSQFGFESDSNIIRRVQVVDATGVPVSYVTTGGDLFVDVELEVPSKARQPILGINISTSSGVRVCTLSNAFTGEDLGDIKGRAIFRCTLPRLQLVEGLYILRVGYDDEAGRTDRADDVAQFEVLTGSSKDKRVQTRPHGLVTLPCLWSRI